MSNADRLGSYPLNQPDPTLYRLDFGPYKGFTLREIYRTDPVYVRKLVREHQEDLPQLAEWVRLLEHEPVRSAKVGLLATIIFILLVLAIVTVILLTML